MSNEKNVYMLEGSTSRFSTMGAQLLDKSRECVSQIMIIMYRAQRIFFFYPFVLPYVLWFKQRDAAKRHKACVYPMSCEQRENIMHSGRGGVNGEEDAAEQ